MSLLVALSCFWHPWQTHLNLELFFPLWCAIYQLFIYSISRCIKCCSILCEPVLLDWNGQSSSYMWSCSVFLLSVQFLSLTLSWYHNLHWPNMIDELRRHVLIGLRLWLTARIDPVTVSHGVTGQSLSAAQVAWVHWWRRLQSFCWYCYSCMVCMLRVMMVFDTVTHGVLTNFKQFAGTQMVWIISVLYWGWFSRVASFINGDHWWFILGLFTRLRFRFQELFVISVLCWWHSSQYACKCDEKKLETWQIWFSNSNWVYLDWGPQLC